LKNGSSYSKYNENTDLQKIMEKDRRIVDQYKEAGSKSKLLHND
jgi:hypothetical protein